MKLERVFTGIIALLGLCSMLYGLTFEARIAYDPIGPKPFPVIIMGLIFVSSLYLTFRPARLSEKIDLNLSSHTLLRIALCVLTLALYSAFLEILGFPIATALLSFFLSKLFQGKTIAALITAVAMGGMSFLLFDILLDVPLPLGILG